MWHSDCQISRIKLLFTLACRGGSRIWSGGGAQIVTGLKLPFWGLSFVEFWCWGLIFGGQGGGARAPPPGLVWIDHKELCLCALNKHHAVETNFVVTIKTRSQAKLDNQFFPSTCCPWCLQTKLDYTSWPFQYNWELCAPMAKFDPPTHFGSSQLSRKWVYKPKTKCIQ